MLFVTNGSFMLGFFFSYVALAFLELLKIAPLDVSNKGIYITVHHVQDGEFTSNLDHEDPSNV